MKKIVLLFVFVLSLLSLSACKLEDKPSFTVKVVDTKDTLLYEAVVDYKVELKNSPLDAIETKVDLDYETSAYGAFIKGVAGFYPKDSSYWFSIYIDNEMINVGLDQIEIKENMEIVFKESTMKDDLSKFVDEVIYEFIKSDLGDYISDDKIDYYVFQSYHLLQSFNPNLSKLSILLDQTKLALTYQNETDLPSAFRKTIYFKAFNLGLTNTSAYLSNQSVSPSPYAVYSYYPLVLSKYMIDQTVDHVHLTKLANEVEIADADYAGMALQLLSLDEVTYQDRVNELITYLETNVEANGFLDYSAKTSASTTAQVVLGLLSLGIDPTNFNGVNLIEALMSYHTNGGFKNNLDGDVDLMFSTPQVITSLIIYKLYNDSYVKTKMPLFQ